MFTFTILILPLAIAFYYIKSENKSNLLLIIIGLLTGAFICAFKAFFSFSHRIVPYSFIENFLFFFFKESFIPIVVFYAVFFLVSKDEKEFKISAFFPLVSSFYAVYLPYIITSSPQAKALFSIFIKPLIFLAMLYMIAGCLKFVFQDDKPALQKIIIGSLITVIYIASPSIIETIWIMNLSALAWTLSSAVIICVPLVILFLKLIARKE